VWVCVGGCQTLVYITTINCMQLLPMSLAMTFTLAMAMGNGSGRGSGKTALPALSMPLPQQDALSLDLQKCARARALFKFICKSFQLPALEFFFYIAIWFFTTGVSVNVGVGSDNCKRICIETISFKFNVRSCPASNFFTQFQRVKIPQQTIKKKQKKNKQGETKILRRQKSFSLRLRNGRFN